MLHDQALRLPSGSICVQPFALQATASLATPCYAALLTVSLSLGLETPVIPLAAATTQGAGSACPLAANSSSSDPGTCKAAVSQHGAVRCAAPCQSICKLGVIPSAH